MVHFNVAEENGDVIDEKTQVSFIMEFSKSFFQFRTNVMKNKIEYNLTALLNELQTYQSLLTNKGQTGEANVAISKKLLSKCCIGVTVGIRALGHRSCRLAYDVGLGYFHGPLTKASSPLGICSSYFILFF